MNPYLPNENESKKYFDALPIGDVEEMMREISLIRPYKTAEDVQKAIDRNDENIRDTYAKMHSSLRKNEEEMLKIIKHDARAYVYVDNPSREFNKRALSVNPKVYCLLSDSERGSQEISNAYLASMKNHIIKQKLPNQSPMRGQISREIISQTEYAMMFQHQFSSTTNLAQVFSSQNYKEAYERMVKDGAYIDNAYTADAMYIAAARERTKNDIKLNQEYDSIEKDIWYDNIGRNAIEQAAYSNRDPYSKEHELLVAAEERVPEIKTWIDRQTQQYKEDKERLIKLTVRDELGMSLEQKDQAFLQEHHRALELNEKEKARVQKVVEKVREESAYYLQRDSVENIYAAYVAGEISLSDAMYGAGRIQGLQSHGSHGRVVEMTAQAEDLEQHHAMDISDPQHSEGSENDREFEELEAAREQEEERDLYESEYAGNPFVSYEDPNGMEPTFNPYSN